LEQNYGLGAVMSGDGDVGVAVAADLIAFADAAVRGDVDGVARARDLLVSGTGEAAMLDAAAVIGGFDGITRIADATGIPLEPAKAEQTADFRETLDIDRFRRDKS
jgi:hypothetical protein